MSKSELTELVAEIRACRLCEADLPLGPRPVLRVQPTARILIVGQAPGTKVHETGIPWNDPSGVRLREWMQVERETFYDERHIAIVPMGFCYPGRLSAGGDRPPRPECSRTWHPRLLPLLPQIGLTILAGSYSHAFFLGKRRRKTLTETVRAWRDYAPEIMALPHPSWRTTGWQRRNPWFEAEVLPELRQHVSRLLAAAV